MRLCTTAIEIDIPPSVSEALTVQLATDNTVPDARKLVYTITDMAVDPVQWHGSAEVLLLSLASCYIRAPMHTNIAHIIKGQKTAVFQKQPGPRRVFLG